MSSLHALCCCHQWRSKNMTSRFFRSMYNKTIIIRFSFVISRMAVFTLADAQIVWTDKSFSDEQIVIVCLMWKQTNKFFNKQIMWYLVVWKDNFSRTICPSRQTSRRQYQINSHRTDKCQMICSSSSVKTAIIKLVNNWALFWIGLAL